MARKKNNKSGIVETPQVDDPRENPAGHGYDLADCLAYSLGIEREDTDIPIHDKSPGFAGAEIPEEVYPVMVDVLEVSDDMIPPDEGIPVDPDIQDDLPGSPDEPEIIPMVLPRQLYIVTRQGIALKRDPEYIKKMANQMQTEGMNKYIVFRGSTPELMAIMPDIDKVKPMMNPDPTKIHTTPPQLYAKAITYAKTMTRLVKRRLSGSGDPMSRTSKMIWVIGLSVITLFIIFMLVVMVMDNFGSDSETDTGSSNIQNGVTVNPSGQGPQLDLTPTPTQGTPQDDPRVIIPPAGS